MANIETDKVTIPVNAPEDGKLTELFAKEGDTVEVGSNLFSIDTEDATPKEAVVVKETIKAQKEDMKFEVKEIRDTEPKSQEPQSADTIEAKSPTKDIKIQVSPEAKSHNVIAKNIVGETSRLERKEPMSRMRQRIAERMKEAQNTAASLTTFNEVDMSALSRIRSTLRNVFQEKHGIKLGFMSAFVKACAIALQEFPMVNAQIENDSKSIVLHDYVDISVAVATPKVKNILFFQGIGDAGHSELRKAKPGRDRKDAGGARQEGPGRDHHDG